MFRYSRRISFAVNILFLLFSLGIVSNQSAQLQDVTPTAEPTLPVEVTAEPTVEVTVEPTATIIVEPTATFTDVPTLEPTVEPTLLPTIEVTLEATPEVTSEATAEITFEAPTPTAEGVIEQDFGAFAALAASGLEVFPNLNLYPSSHIYSLVPANATRTRATNIGSFRPGYEEWQAPVYRVPAGDVYPLVRVTNTYSGRVENWEIPTWAVPADEDDAHMAVINMNTGMVYEFWAAEWQGTTAIRAGGMVAFPINGTGTSNPPNRRVTASGFANTNGSIMLEDFYNPATGSYTVQPIGHALTMNLPASVLSTGYVSPAIGGEEAGSAGSNGYRMGERFALPANLNVDALNVHPFVREILRAARDYGVYVGDGSGSAAYQGLAAGTIEVEPGLVNRMFGLQHNDFLNTIQSQTYSIVQQYGLWRITGGTTVPATSTPIVTNTSIPVTPVTVVPTATIRPSATATRTPSPTATRTPIVTVVPTITRTPSPTRTPITATPVTPVTVVPTVRPSATATRTPIPVTATPIVTPLPVTPVPTNSGAFNVRLVAPLTVRQGSQFTVDVILDNVGSFSGGGIRRAIVECTLIPYGRLTGNSAVVTTMTSGATVDNRNFRYSDWTYLDVQWRDIYLTTGGVLETFTITANSRGIAAVNCTARITGARGSQRVLRFTTTVTVVR